MALILVVDDEPLDLEMMRDALATAGYAVITATDGKEALVMYQQHQECFDPRAIVGLNSHLLRIVHWPADCS